jgi:hypothetical protein
MGSSFVMIQSIMLSVDNEHAYSIYTLLGSGGTWKQGDPWY